MEPLPRGRHGLSREYVDQNQRDRLREAAVICLGKQGYSDTTVASISKLACVSKSDFYKHFQTKEECFFDAYDEAVGNLRRRVAGACEGAGDWASAVRAGLGSVLSFLAGDPARARFLLIEGLRNGREIRTRFRAAQEEFAGLLAGVAPALDGDRPDGTPSEADGPGATQPDATVEEQVVGGVTALLSQRILAGDPWEAEDLLPDIAEFALTPYLGTAEARRIISAG